MPTGTRPAPRSNRIKGASRFDVVPVEERIFAIAGRAQVEARDAGSDDKLGFFGHAAVFNQKTAIGNPLTWGFYEQCAAGCFDKTLQENPDVYFCQDHDPGKILARTSNATLRLSTDTIGLVTDADMAPVTYARDIAVLVDRGDIKGMSFRFQVVKDDWTTETVTTSDGQSAEVETRTLLELKLIDVTVTAIPAYPTTDASLRTAADAAREARELFLIPLEIPQDLRPGGDGEPDGEGDTDEDEEGDEDNTDPLKRSRRQPASTTATGSNGQPEPERSTRTSTEHLKMRQQAIAHRFGLPEAAAGE